MAENQITLVSTTDTKEDVAAAMSAPQQAEPSPQQTADAQSVVAPEVAQQGADVPVTEPDIVTEPVKEAQPTAEPAKPPAKPEKKRGLDARKEEIQAEIDRLLWHKHATEREAAEARAYLERLNAERVQVDAQRLQQAQPPTQPATGQSAAAPGVDVGSVPKEEDFATIAEFVQAMSAYQAKQAALEAEGRLRQEWEARRATEQAGLQQRLQMEQQAMLNAQAEAELAARVEAARKKYEDFDEVVNQPVSVSPIVAGIARYGRAGTDLAYKLGADAEFAAKASAIPITAPVRDALLGSEHPAELMGYLVEHPAEYEQIARSHPIVSLTMMGRLEERITRAIEASTPAAIAQPITRPTVLPTGAVAGRSATVGKPLDELPYQEYKRQREAHERAARSR